MEFIGYMTFVPTGASRAQWPRARVASWKGFGAPDEESKGIIRKLIREWLGWHEESFGVSPELGVEVCVIGLSMGVRFLVAQGPPRYYIIKLVYIFWP